MTAGLTNTNQELTEAIAVVRGLHDTFTSIRDAIREVPRGPWQLKGEVGIDRELFEFGDRQVIDAAVDFTDAREAFEAFLLKVGKHGLLVDVRGTALVDALSASLPDVVSGSDQSGFGEVLQTTSEAAEIAAKAVAKYRQHLEAYPDQIAVVRGRASPAISAEIDRHAATITGESAAAQQLRAQLEALGESFKDAIETVHSEIGTVAPAEAARLAEAIETVKGALGESQKALLASGDTAALASAWRSALKHQH